MGAVSVYREGKGRSMEDAFETLREQAESEHGSDIYNGEINNAELVGDWTHKYNGKNINKLYDEAINNLSKPDVVGVCTRKPKPNKNKTKTTVERFPQKGTRKWKTVFVARNSWTGEDVLSASSQTVCIHNARAYVEKNPEERLEIYITKELEKGNGIVSVVRYKESKTEQLGEYVFMGWVRD